MESNRTYRDAAGRDIRLPREVYYRCLWTVRDAKRLEKLASVLSDEASAAGGFSLTSPEEDNKQSVSVIAEDVAMRAARELDCIRRALGRVPEVYREGLMDNICDKTPLGDYAHPNTWKRWKLVFMYELARELRMI